MVITARQIRAARGLLEWSGDQLAEKVGVTRATLSKIESDLVQPQERTLGRIAEVLDMQGVAIYRRRWRQAAPAGSAGIQWQGRIPPVPRSYLSDAQERGTYPSVQSE